jgi:hypothetical protein
MFIFDPFPNGVLAKLNVPGSLRGHIVGSLDAQVIVIVEDSGGVNVGKFVTCIRDTAREIPEVKDFLGCRIGSADLGFTVSKGCAFLLFAKPANGAAIFEDDATIHTAELNSRRSRPPAMELPN